MVDKVRMWRLWLPLLSCVCASSLNAATVLWYGGPIVTPVVTDQNIDIQGANTMGTNILVQSVTRDILITVTAVDSSITSTVNNTSFCLKAASGHTITMDLNFTLSYVAGATLTNPFVVEFEGPGNFVVNIEGGKQIAFTKALSATVGTWFFDVMNATANPTVTFARSPGLLVPNSDATVLVDSLGVISYLAQTAVSTGTSGELGTITFNPTNPTPNYGALILQINNGGSVMVAGRQYTADCPSYPNLLMNVPAGLEATMSVVNSNTATSIAPFIVQNYNNTYGPNNLLIDPFCQRNYTGLIYGFTLQANGQIILNNQSYLFYIGNTNNVSPLGDVLGSCNWALHQTIKTRNPSAFTVDGNLTTTNAIPAQLLMNSTSALYLASDADCGNCQSVVKTGSVFTQIIFGNIDVTGAGNTVLDVEGRFNVFGDSFQNSAINIVSLVPALTGGSVLIEDFSTTNFPLRTFSLTPDGHYQQFSRGNILVNNVMRLFLTNLKHDDRRHIVTPLLWLPDNSLLVQPEPAYIGGERNINPPSPCSTTVTGTGCGPSNNDAIEFVKSYFLLHTDAAAVGMTLRVPNYDPSGNTSYFKFYSNGQCIDQGVGRSLVLGSITGALAVDGQHVIDPNAYIDVFQTTTAINPVQALYLITGYNNQKVTQGLTGNIQGQDVTQSIVDLYGSNECIGTDTTTQAPAFTLVTTPSLIIAGNFFNFVSQGGQLQDPTSSGATGQGGIFVDTNGTFSILPNYRALMGKVVAVSDNGYVKLPSTQVLFVNGAAIQRWHLNLTQPSQQVIVPGGQHYSNFTLDWKATVKDFCVTTSYVPYNFFVTTTAGCPSLAYLNPMTTQNLTGLPIIYGEVSQLQLKNGTIGNQPSVIVDGTYADAVGGASVDNGLVREVVFLNSTQPGTAPVGMIILQNDAFVGIGTSNRGNPVSTQAQMVLGTNGLTLAANGNATVQLNQDVIINNLCHILTGPSFGASGLQRLLITSQVPREIRVKSTGILDLTQFGNSNQRLTIGGQVKIVLEPGAQVVLGSGQLYLIDNAEIVLEVFNSQTYPAGTAATSTDPYRVKFSSVATGTGGPSIFTLQENSRMFIPRGTLLGIETNPCVSGTTSQSWAVQDDASLEIGGNTKVDEYGGGIQVGNTTSQPGATINWTLILNGGGALFEIGSQGFLGIGKGIVNKPNTGPDFWTITDLANVGSINIILTEGTFANQTLAPAAIPPAFPGQNPLSSLIVLGHATNYTFSFDRVNSLVLGGGNLIYVDTVGTGTFNPVVGTTNGSVTTGGVTYNAGVLASTVLLTDPSKTGGSGANPFVVTGNAVTVGSFLAVNDYTSQIGKKAVIAPFGLGVELAGYIYQGVIYRPIATNFRSGSVGVGSTQANLIGAAGLSLNTSTIPPAPTYTILNP
jgi:hypothetical protein